MRSAAVAMLVVVAAGLAALLVFGATDKRQLAFTLGVAPGGAVAELKRGERACQVGFDVANPFSRMVVDPGTYDRPGPALEATVRALPSGRLLGRGRVPAGYADNQSLGIEVGDVPAGQRVAACIRNLGPGRVALYGNADVAARSSSATVDDRPIERDLTMRFERSEPVSTLSLIPTIVDRAALFKGGVVGTWTLWLLLAGVVLGVPALLAWALWSARDRL